MSKKKTTPNTPTANQQSLKIGSRVRCTDDGVTGRITWANGVSVKIKWDDGESVTWRRDSLAGRPITILDADHDAAADAQPEQLAVQAAAELPTTPEVLLAEPDATVSPASEQSTTPEASAAPEANAAEQVVTAPPPAVAEATQAEVSAETPPAGETEPQAPLPEPLSDQDEGAKPETPVAVAQSKRERKSKVAADPKEKKLSALDAAAKVLAEAGQPMTCKEMIGAMASKGYWSSPGGKTPDATLCSAILREIKVKGDKSRFVKTGPGRFAFRPTT